MAQPILQQSVLPFWHWLTYGRLLLASAWIVCLSLAVGRHVRSATEFDDDTRIPPTVTNPLTGKNFLSSGNYGHMEVDFGAQWLMGRMIVRGYGHELYNRTRLRQVLNESFHIENEPPNHRLHRFPKELRPADLEKAELSSDAEMLMAWMVGSQHESPRWGEFGQLVAVSLSGGTQPLASAAVIQASADATPAGLAESLSEPSLGGPLYPPVHAILYAPLAMIDDPRIAYYVFQLLSTLSIIVAAVAVRFMTEGRIWTPVAGVLLMLYPGFQPGLTLAQNHAVSLAIVMAGWALACRGRPLAGGIVWGFLAFKPVWAVVFGLVPLMMLKPRFLGGMAASGIGLVAATFHFVGVRGWQDWLANGAEATKVYNRNSNWINLSRDLSGIVRRLTIDFGADEMVRNKPVYALFGSVAKYSLADLVSWALLFAVFGATVLVYAVWGKPRKPLGLSAGFLFLGFYLCCFRFMYYDALLSAMGVFALFAYPKWFLRDSSPVRFGGAGATQWLPILLFSLLLLLGMGLMRLGAAATARWIAYVDRTLTGVAVMDSGGVAVWAGVLGVLFMGGYWLLHRAGHRPGGERADPIARRCSVKIDSLSLLLLSQLLLLQAYLLQVRPEATISWRGFRSLPTAITASVNYEFAVDTFLILGLWAWAGIRMIRGGRRPESD